MMNFKRLRRMFHTLLRTRGEIHTCACTTTRTHTYIHTQTHVHACMPPIDERYFLHQRSSENNGEDTYAYTGDHQGTRQLAKNRVGKEVKG